VPDPNTTAVAPPLLVDAREAARLLSVSARTLWRLTKDGEVPSVRIGRRVLFAPDALRAWVAVKVRVPT
jgi:excisionase family DNA binding protein